MSTEPKDYSDYALSYHDRGWYVLWELKNEATGHVLGGGTSRTMDDMIVEVEMLMSTVTV